MPSEATAGQPPARGVSLGDLVATARSASGRPDLVAGWDGDGPEVTAVMLDSRLVTPGALFVCVPGAIHDGHDFAPEAVERGAVALLVERPLDLDVPQILTPDARRAVGHLASAVHGTPSRQLTVVGFTGTNGKTTSVHLLEHVLEHGGIPTGVIGTLTGERTTPEATVLQRRLAAMVAEGRMAVAMEVSSHSLAQHRVDGTWFSVAVFTNLSIDHLDFHGDLESYYLAKAALFTPDRVGAAVINVDSPEGRRLAGSVDVAVTESSIADAEALELDIDGCTFGWRGQPVRLPLAGRFNVANALGVAEAASLAGLDDEAIAAGLSAGGRVPGRFELVDGGQPFSVVVDYAHTPDGLRNVLTTARELTGRRLICVFGCGGDRDRAKRPLMGEVTSSLADVVIVTSDNPRSEDPDAIIAAIVAGATGGAELSIEPDRRRAIEQALNAAAAGDIVVIAGKGHETTQTVGAEVLDFDDRLVALDVLERAS